VEYLSGLNQVPQTISFLTIGVQVGEEATVYVEALNVDVPGQVARISPMASTLGGDVVYTVVVALGRSSRTGCAWG